MMKADLRKSRSREEALQEASNRYARQVTSLMLQLDEARKALEESGHTGSCSSGDGHWEYYERSDSSQGVDL
jgi:hypothetical protein